MQYHATTNPNPNTYINPTLTLASLVVAWYGMCCISRNVEMNVYLLFNIYFNFANYSKTTLKKIAAYFFDCADNTLFGNVTKWLTDKPY